MARILVVDDSSTLRKVVCSILERKGHKAIAAHDGATALDILSRSHREGEEPQTFDLVLVDFVMPRMNGFQFCRALRNREDLRALPVVLMSAKSDRIREQFVHQTGALDAISKPFDAQALTTLVEHALERVKSGWTPEKASQRSDPAPSSNERREESDLRKRVTVEFGAKLLNIISPAIAEITGDESKVMQALGNTLTPETLAELAGAVRDVDLGDKSVILSGALNAVPIGAVLQLLQIEGMSGSLRVFGLGSDITITMRAGLVDLVQGRGAGDEFRIGRFFIEDGHVTQDELEEIVQTSQRTSSAPKLLGELMLESGKINDEQLRHALTRQSSELIYEVLRWRSGRFEFAARGVSPLAERAKLGMPVASAVMEGFRRVDEWRVMEDKLGSFDQVLQPDPVSIEALGEEKLARAERAVLSAIDGRRTVREIIGASHLSSFDACRILFQFLEARLVRRKAA